MVVGADEVGEGRRWKSRTERERRGDSVEEKVITFEATGGGGSVGGRSVPLLFRRDGERMPGCFALSGQTRKGPEPRSDKGMRGDVRSERLSAVLLLFCDMCSCESMSKKELHADGRARARTLGVCGGRWRESPSRRPIWVHLMASPRWQECVESR